MEPEVVENKEFTFKFPLVFIVGCPRSGSTLLMQWMANSGYFAAPDNFLSRFYRSPYVGQLIKDMLFDPRYAFRDELADLLPLSPDYHSSLGKTKGTLAVNEFYFFWRELFSIPVHYPTLSEADSFNLSKARYELDRLISYVQKPFLCKGLMFNQVLSRVAEWFPEAVFLHLRRESFFTAQSLLMARETFYQDRKQWYSFQIPEHEQLKSCSPFEQVAGQVTYTEAAVSRQLAAMPKHRYLTIQYEELVANPEAVWRHLKEQPLLQPTLAERPYGGPEKFEQKNVLRLSSDEAADLETALDKLTAKVAQPEGDPAHAI